MKDFKINLISALIATIVLFAIPAIVIFGIVLPANRTVTKAAEQPLADANGYRLTIFIDPETGVNYIRSGYDGITPRYNADGSLYVTDVE